MTMLSHSHRSQGKIVFTWVFPLGSSSGTAAGLLSYTILAMNLVSAVQRFEAVVYKVGQLRCVDVPEEVAFARHPHRTNGAP